MMKRWGNLILDSTCQVEGERWRCSRVHELSTGLYVGAHGYLSLSQRAETLALDDEA